MVFDNFVIDLGFYSFYIACAILKATRGVDDHFHVRSSCRVKLNLSGIPLSDMRVIL